MKRFSTLLFIFFAAIVFSPVGYSQFALRVPGLNVSITVPSDVQNGAFDASIRFTEEVADFVQSDVGLAGTATASITGWSSTDDLIFTATITPVTSGTVIISVPTDVATDAGGTQNNAAMPQTVTVDVDAPSVGIAVPSVAQSGAFDVTITFTEAVSGFEQADLSVSGTASITGWTTTDDTVFTATITPTTSGEVTLNIAENVATDTAGNPNTASESQTVTVTVEPETVWIPDANLRSAVRDKLGLADDEALTKTKMLELTTLYAPRRQIENLTGLEYATNLDMLLLKDNDLGSLPSGIFDELTALTRLYLDNNDLGSLPSGIFEGLTALKDLDLGDNGLSHLPSSLPSGIFDELIALETLDLSFNDLDSLPADFFDNLTELRTLDLDNTSLDPLPAGIFDELTALTHLYLDNNGLGSLPSGIFEGLTALETLDLHNNNFISLPSDVFDGLTALTDLNLSYNDLNSLLADVFEGLTALEDLDLENNDLSSLPEGIFVGLTSLERLYIEENTVDPLPLTVSLEKVGENQVKAVAPTGAPFNIVFSPTITNGSLEDDATTLTISTGSSESDPVTVIQTPGSTDAVTVDISALPSPPTSSFGGDPDHNGYVLSKPADLPLEVIGAGNGAPALGMTHLIDSEVLKSLDPVAVAAQLAILRAKSDGSLKYLRAIALLESVLASMRPEITLLLANYPNPFNPETWIPYHLANAGDVVITIYDMRGTVVRRLDLGHQLVGYYTSRVRAAYWDGRNDFGERVASGVYFYQLQTDDQYLLRKMLVLK